MKKIILAFLLFSCLALALSAQGGSTQAKGTLGLQFTMAGLGTFGIAGLPIDAAADTAPSTDYGLGAKYGLGKNLAIGLSLFVGGSSATDNAGTVDTSFDLSLRPAFLLGLLSKGPVSLYTGAYVSGGFYSDTMNTANRSHSSSMFGFGGLLGAEYFVTSGISLGAEYSLGAHFFNSTTTVISTSVETKTSESEWGVGTAAVFLTFYL
jgi:hypothetical protein